MELFVIILLLPFPATATLVLARPCEASIFRVIEILMFDNRKLVVCFAFISATLKTHLARNLLLIFNVKLCIANIQVG